MSGLYKLDEAQVLMFLMISSADHISPATGLTPTVTLSKDGGAFAAAAGAVSEVGNGWYKVAADEDNFDTLGPLILHATAGGADPTDVEYMVWDAMVDLGPAQSTTIIGNIQGSVESVLDPVTCVSSAKCKCKKKKCKCCC